MRILYGVVGEGMGHAMRSRVVLDHLTRDHDVQVVVSGRAYDYLVQRAGEGAGEHLGVRKIWGYSVVYDDNEVSSLRTLLANIKGAVRGWPENARAYVEMTAQTELGSPSGVFRGRAREPSQGSRMIDRFEPDVVISDFESWSYLFAVKRGLPVLSLDNMQILNRCAHAPEILAGHEADFRLAKAIVKAKVAGAFHYLITTFFHPPLRKRRTTLVPPILRPEILAAGATARAQGPAGRGDHVLVYQTSTSAGALPAMLARTGRECRIYGLRRELREEVVEGNLRYRPFSEAGFIEDLRSARGVIAAGGFTLMGEAVYLGRPMLAIPIGKQFEQLMNARYLEKEGYGLCAEQPSEARLGEFLERIPDFERRLAGYTQDGNQQALAALDHWLAQAARRGRGPELGEPGGADDGDNDDDDDDDRAR